MNSKIVYAIGLMSGTSLDGLDMVYVKFDISKDYQYEILTAETEPYSPSLKYQLQNAIHLSNKDLEKFDKNYGTFLGKSVNDFISRNQIKNLDYVASHGHTIFHQPEKGITKQIGSGEYLMRTIQKKVVCDFRSQDVRYGGQGAPLVPIGDKLLFSSFDACINLGGFSNISFEREEQRLAYDICPVNTVLNLFSSKLGCSFDNKGELARTGVIDMEILNNLNSLEYYSKPNPKSLGIEWVQHYILPILNTSHSIQDALRTYVEHCAIQISDAIESFDSVLFTGGGVFNQFLMERIQFLSEVNIVIPDKLIVEYKEAFIFAFLGLRRIENKVNCLASVTGAKSDHSSGEIFNFN